MLGNNLQEQISKLIDNYKGTELWLEAVKLAVKTNPKIAQEVLFVIRENRDIRSSLSDTKYAKSTTASMRMGTRVPRSLEDVLMIVDPDTFPINTAKDMKKFAKAFPEFLIPEKI